MSGSSAGPPLAETVSESPPAPSPFLSGWSDDKLIVLLVLCSFLPYANILANGFVYDDNTQVLNNPYIQNFRHLREIFSTNVWSYVGAQGVSNYYRPLMTFGYLICYQLFGPVAYGFHLVSILIHSAIVLMLFKVTGRMFGSRALAFIAAAAFALHPVHTESVAWIAAVTDLELTFFFLLTFWLFLGVARPGGGRSELTQLAIVGSFALTILSKEQALMLPPLATAYEHFYRDDRAETTGRQKLSRYGTLWLLAVAYMLFRIRFFGALAPVLQISHFTLYQAVLSGITLMGQYFAKLLWPVHLCAFYVFQKSETLLDPRVLAGLGALALFAALFVFFWKRHRMVSFGMVWLVVTLGPVLNARWMAANVFTERYLYLPSVGFCWVLAWALERMWARASERGVAWRRSLAATLAVLAALSVARVVTRNRVWKDDVTLFTDTLKSSPGAYHIRTNLGAVYWNHGDVKPAEREWLEALRLAPRGVVILNNLGLVRAQQKRYDEAVEFYRRSMQLRPNYADPHLNLGVAYEEMGYYGLAELQLRTAVALSPLNVRARNELGHLLLQSCRFAAAEEQFQRSVESEPNVGGYLGLGDVYASLNDLARAELAYQQTVAADPYDSRAHFSLGKIYLDTGRNSDARREFQAGLMTDPKNSEAMAALDKLRHQPTDAKKPAQ